MRAFHLAVVVVVPILVDEAAHGQTPPTLVPVKGAAHVLTATAINLGASFTCNNPGAPPLNGTVTVAKAAIENGDWVPISSPSPSVLLQSAYGESWTSPAQQTNVQFRAGEISHAIRLSCAPVGTDTPVTLTVPVTAGNPSPITTTVTMLAPRVTSMSVSSPYVIMKECDSPPQTLPTQTLTLSVSLSGPATSAGMSVPISAALAENQYLQAISFRYLISVPTSVAVGPLVSSATSPIVVQQNPQMGSADIVYTLTTPGVTGVQAKFSAYQRTFSSIAAQPSSITAGTTGQIAISLDHPLPVPVSVPVTLIHALVSSPEPITVNVANAVFAPNQITANATVTTSTVGSGTYSPNFWYIKPLQFNTSSGSWTMYINHQ